MQRFHELLYLAPPHKLVSAVVHLILERYLKKLLCIDSLDMNYLEANNMIANIKQRESISLCM